MRLPRHDAPEIDIFDNDEWELFEHLLGERWRPQAEFGLVSMARPSEIGALPVGDIDPETGAVRITKAWKDGGSKLELSQEKGWQPALRRLGALARGDFEPFGKKALWRGAAPEELIARYGTAIRTLRGKHLTPYTLRHTGISWKLQDGVPMFVVSRDAGHESTSTADRRYGHINRAASESAAQVIAAVAVAVARVDPLLGAFAVAGTADRIGLGGYQRLEERRHHVAQQIRAGDGELIGQHLGRVDRLDRGHRVVLLRVTSVGLLTDHAVTVLYPATTRSDFADLWSYTTLPDATENTSPQNS